MQLQALTGARVFTGDAFLDRQAVLLADGRIDRVCPVDEVHLDARRIGLDGGTLAPGFIDLQVNGGGGVLFNNSPTAPALRTMLAGHRHGGTTALLPTLISDTTNAMQKGLHAVRESIDSGLESVLGVHFEGPFLDRARRGAHRADSIRALSDGDVDWLTSAASQCRVMLTLAPEHAKRGQIRALADAGVIVCGGHSAAGYRETADAIGEGLSGFTHLFNAMSPLGSREPGVVGAALSDPNTWCGIIVDGHHVHPATVAVALRAKPPGKLYLVTDSMATAGSTGKSFELYDETITESDGRLINHEGRLAGSAISMIDAVRLTHREVGADLGECLRMASLYPAQFVGESERRGRIARGFRADLVHFGDDFEVLNTWVGGHRQSHSGTSAP